MERCHGFDPTSEEEFWTQCEKKATHQLAEEDFCEEHYWKTTGALLAFLDDGYAVVGLVVLPTRLCAKYGIARDGVRSGSIARYDHRPPKPNASGVVQSLGRNGGERVAKSD